ncbi:MAG: hypothetical protein IJH20_00545 [Bacilli bacterium]|nr:hypothetical protein [Bacilli bacterium]
MSLAQLIELRKLIKLEYELGKSRGYSVHELNRLKDLLGKYDEVVNSLPNDIREENHLTSLSKVRNLVMSIA